MRSGRSTLWTLAIALLFAGCGYDGPQMTVEQLEAALNDPSREITVIDVRSMELFRKGHVPGSINVPRGRIKVAEPELRDLEGEVAVICTCGRNSLAVCKQLAEDGLKNVILVTGGIQKWREAGYPLETGPGVRKP
ncbi:MAG: rhodanese-like domain-containing protein [Polyangia bacterium]